MILHSSPLKPHPQNVDDIAVTFINADTGETVGEAHSSDMAE